MDIAACLRCHSDDVHCTDVVALNSDVNMKNLIRMIYLIYLSNMNMILKRCAKYDVNVQYDVEDMCSI